MGYGDHVSFPDTIRWIHKTYGEYRCSRKTVPEGSYLRSANDIFTKYIERLNYVNYKKPATIYHGETLAE